MHFHSDAIAAAQQAKLATAEIAAPADAPVSVNSELAPVADVQLYMGSTGRVFVGPDSTGPALCGLGVVDRATDPHQGIYIDAVGAFGEGPAVRAIGVEADVDVTLVPQGAGLVAFGYDAAGPMDVPASTDAAAWGKVKFGDTIYYVALSR